MPTQIQANNISLNVSDGTTMPCYVARPQGATPTAGIIVFQEAFGVNHHIRDLTERFAREGYVAIAPALFHRTDPNFEAGYENFDPIRPHMMALTVDGEAADAKAAFDWLVSPEGGNVANVGTSGYCMGGMVSFLADATLPVKASASYYGGGIAPAPAMGRPGLLTAQATSTRLSCCSGADWTSILVQTSGVRSKRR